MMNGFIVKAGEQNEGSRDHSRKQDAPFRGGLLRCAAFPFRLRFLPGQSVNEQKKSSRHENRQKWRYPRTNLEQILQRNGGGAAKAHAPGHVCARHGFQAHAMVRRAADTAQAQRRSHRYDHIQQGSVVQSAQQDHADQEQGKDAACDRRLDALSRAKAEIQAMQQITQNNKYLQCVVNEIPLPGGKIAFSGMIRQAENSKLQKKKAPNI